MTKTKHNNKISKKKREEYRGQLLKWYDRHKRDLPWRAKADQVPDPYHVWLSEIMLQQTTVPAVKAYYTKFLSLWPAIEDLANAPQEQVMAEWAGLGYYARARNLHKCAKQVVADYGGFFPQEQKALKSLPGIGDYTSAAIRAIAFNKPATVMDGNIERVMARLFKIQQPLPKSKPVLKDLTALFFDGFKSRPGDLAQAFMDLGAGICTPKSPRCSLCPLSGICLAAKAGIAPDLPRKEKKKPRPQRHGYVYWIEDGQGRVLSHRRPDKGLLGGMAALPTSEWVDRKASPEHLSFITPEKQGGLSIHHTFTHFDLELVLHKGVVNDMPAGDYDWQDARKLDQNIPSVFQKAFNLFVEKKTGS
jgi:A/G-specific adenine glycosylase